MKRKSVVLVFCLALVLPIAAPLFAADEVVLRVLVVRSDDSAGYLKELEKGKALMKKLGASAVIRVWRARFAGDSAGTIVVAVEYPSLAVMAKDETTLNADPDYQTWFKGIGKLRTVVSDSLYTEMKP